MRWKSKRTQPRLHSDSDIPRPTRFKTPSNRNTAEGEERVQGNSADEVRPLRGIEEPKEVMWYMKIISPLMQLGVSLTADRIPSAFARYSKTVCPASSRRNESFGAPLNGTILFNEILSWVPQRHALCVGLFTPWI
jgi:hypothetical protein